MIPPPHPEADDTLRTMVIPNTYYLYVTGFMLKMPYSVCIQPNYNTHISTSTGVSVAWYRLVLLLYSRHVTHRNWCMDVGSGCWRFTCHTPHTLFTKGFVAGLQTMTEHMLRSLCYVFSVVQTTWYSSNWRGTTRGPQTYILINIV